MFWNAFFFRCVRNQDYVVKGYTSDYKTEQFQVERLINSLPQNPDL